MLKQGKSGSNKGKLGVLLYSALILGAGLTSEQVFANTETNSNSPDTNTIQTNPAAQPLATPGNTESVSTEELTANNPSESEENGTVPVIMKSEAQDQESEVAAHGPLPSEAQLNYHKEELAAFIHFGMNTFTDSEWGNGKENPSSFNPTELDAEQWIKTLKDTGFKRTIMVVKHHDGFALYPSEHTTHDVASSPWKNGQGDVLLEVSEAATKHDMNLGVYLSPWDANHPKYSVATEAEYNEYYLNQLKEILGNDKYGNNGKFVEVWMDGARGSGAEAVTYEFDKWFDYIRQAEGDITIFSSEPTSVRWIGNERGIAGDPVWHKVKRDQFRNANNAYLNSGDPEGDMYSVGEADVSIRPGWFYHANQQPKSLKDLMSIYFQSVGRGTPLLLNIPPDRRGKFADSDVARLQEFHETLEAMYATNLAQGARVTATSTRANRLYNASHLTDGKEDTAWVPARDAKTGEFVVDLGQAREFDVIELKEFIQKGQRIANFEVDVDVNGQWLPYVSGKTVGYRRLLQGQPVTASRLRVRITDAQATPMLSNFAVYKTPKSVELSDGFPFGTTYVSHLDANRHNSQWFEENEGIRGKSMWTNRQGAQVEFQFTGSKAYVVSTIDPNHGEMEVYIDGQKVADVNTQSPTRKRSQLVYTTDDLTHGNHTLKLVNKTGRAIATEGIYILNNNGKGMFEVSTDSLDVPKGREAVVTIRRTGGSQGESTVKVITEPGTGVHGKVYRDTTEVVRFADGETEKTVRIPTLAYTEQADQNFDFTVKLTETTGGSLLGMKTATRVTVLGNQQIVRTPDVNHARGARVEASDVEVAQFSADKAVDGDLTTRWATNKDAATPTLTLTLPEATHIERVEVAWDQRANASRQITADPNVKAWKLSYTSPDQPDVWKVAHVRTGEPVVEESIAIAQPFVAKKLKLEVTDYVAGQLNWRNAAINEFRVFSNRLADTTTPPAADVLNTPDVNHLQGATVVASNVEAGTKFTGDKAVDGKADTRWATDKDAPTPTLTVTLPQTTHIKRVELDWDPRANASRQITADPNVKAWRLSYATADAADQWQVAHERTTADPQVSEVINLATPVNAKYLKLEVLESVAGQLNWNNVGIREIRAYSNPAETIVNTPDVNHLRGAAAVASNVEAGTKFTGDKAVDGQDGTRWATDRNPNKPSLTLTLPNTTHIERVEIDWDPRANASRQITADPNVKAWRLSYATAAAPDQWQVAHERPSGDASLAEVVALSTPINAKYLKLEVLESVAGQLNWNNVGVREIRAYSNLAPAAGSRLDQIQSLSLNKDQTRLVLPDLTGVELVGSDKDGVIDLAGRVYQPLTNQTVKVTLKQTLGSDVLTKEFELAVAGRYADEGVGQKPSVVPVVQQWHGREGISTITNATVLVADDNNFAKAADLYREDLAARGLTLSLGNSTAAQRVEFKKVSDKGYGQEGYGITINNGVITIEADSHTGAFYATRTLLQMGETGLQNGEIRDFPSFSHRGFLLDTGRKFVPYDVVIDIMKNMAYYKMNDLQLHLNDNYIFLKKHIEGKNLTREQELEYVLNNATTGFRAEIDVVGENGVRLTSEEHYTKDQLRELVRLAGDLGINLVPEIDTPGHAMSFVKVRPDLMYKGAELGGHHNVERAAMLDLDAKYNETLAFVKSVYQKLYFDEDAPLKDVTTVHIGTDEYYGSSASYRRYLADMLQYVKEKGKTPRFWGSLSLKTQGQEIDGRGTELQIWNLGWHNPDLALAMGAKVINITDAPTYSVPSGNGSVGGYGDYSGYITQYDRWTPNDFRTAGRQGKNYPASHPQIIGGGHAVWNDNIDLHETGITSYDVFKRFFATMTVTADKTWGSPRLAPAFKDRQTLPEERLYAPNTNPEYRSAIDNITIGKDSLAALTSEGVTAGAEGLTFGKQEDYLATGLGQVGPNAVLNLEVTLDGTGPQGILTDGRNGIFLSDKDGKLAYAFEHLHVQFDKTLEPGRRYKVTFVTKELNTDVYVDDVKVARLPQAEHPALAYTSFVLPLDYVTGFKGTLHSLNLSTAPYVNPNIVNPQEFASIVASNQDNEHGGEISMAFDGNTGTIWHSDWVKKDPTYTVDMRLKEATALRRFTYLPRQSGTNGNILRYELYAKRDGALTKIAEGSWANDATEKEVLFDNLTTDHVQLKVLEGAGGFASAAELTLHKVRVAQPQPENQGNGTGSNPGTDTGNKPGADSGNTGGTGTGSSTGSDTGNTGGTGTNTGNTGGDGIGTGTETGGTGTSTNTGTETRPTTLPNREVPESVPFETLKTNDPNLDLGQEVTDREGVPGRMIKVYEVTIKDGQEVLKLIDIKDIVLPEAKLVRVGTRPAAASFTNQVEETEDVPFEPVTVDDPNLDLGQRVTVRDGVPGRVTKIYDVTYDAAGKEVSRVFVAEKNRLDPVYPLILVGTRPIENRRTELREVSEVIAFETETITDENLDLGQEVIARKGVNGKRIKVYDVTFVNGENVGERLIEVKETLAPINQLVRVGTRPVAVSQTESREVIEAIDFDVEIIEDSNLELGMEVVVREGVKGSLVKVYEDTYVNGLKTGERLIDIKDMIAPVTKLVVVGKKVVSPEVLPQATTSDDAPSTETPQVVSPDDVPPTETPQVVSPDDAPSTETPQVVSPDDVPPTETPQVVTPDDAPSTETPQATTPVVVATPRDLVDPASKVHVLLDKDENPEIVGVRISHKETNDTATPAVLLGKDYDLFDIVTVDKFGQVLPISKSALVTLPVDEGKVVEKVFYLPEGGQPEERAFKMTSLTDENGGTRSAVAFIAEHFSDYGIIYQSASSSVLGEQGLPIGDSVMTPLKPVQISTPAQKVETRSEVVATSVPKNQVEGKAILPETGDSASSLVAIGAASLLATLGMAALRKHD